MKKNITILFTLVIAFIATNVQAQEIPPGKNYLGLYMGVSEPVGVFKNTDYYNNNAGFAKRGITYGINWAHYFTKHIAAVADISFQDQGRPTTDELQTLSDGYNADYKAQSTTVSVTQRYQNFNFLLGPQYSFYFGDFSFDLGVSAGLLRSTDTPEYELTVYKTTVGTTTGTTQIFYQRSSPGSAFAYSGNIGLHYSVSSVFGFSLTGKYVGSEGITINNESNPYTVGRLVTKQPINVMQTTFGIFFHF